MKVITEAVSIFRHRSGEQKTPQDRSRERYRLAALTASATFLAKGISIAATLVTVRLLFQYLGAERYGMWMTISSIVMMFGAADLGTSSGLVNVIAEASGKGDQFEAQSASASAFWMQSAIAAFLSFVAIAVLRFIDTARLFNVHSALAAKEAGPAVLIFFLCVAANLPLGTIRGVQTGLQKGFLNSLWWTFGSLLSLVALLVVIKTHGGLPLLVLALSGTPVIALLMNGIELFGWSHPELLPDPKKFSRRSASTIFHTGLMYFLLQLSLTIGMQTDTIVIAQIMGAQVVPLYSVPWRMFNVLVSLAGMAYGSMWPAYADAFARQDVGWIKRGFRRVATIGIGVNVVLATVLVLFGNKILAVWVGPQIQGSRSLLIAMGVSCVLMAFVNCASVLLNGLGKFRAQVFFGLLMAVVNLLLSILLVKRYGIIGAVIGTVIAIALVQVVPMAILTKMSLSKLGVSSVTDDETINSKIISGGMGGASTSCPQIGDDDVVSSFRAQGDSDS